MIILLKLNAEIDDAEEVEFEMGGDETAAGFAHAGIKAASEIELLRTERTLLKIFSLESSVMESIFSSPFSVSSIFLTWVLYTGSRC